MIKLNFNNLHNFSFTAREKKKETTQNAVAQTADSKLDTQIPPIAFQQFMIKNKPNNSSRLSIYYYNDTHGNSDKMAGILNNAKKFQDDMQNSSREGLILSAGDNCSGGDSKKNEYIFDLMQNIMGVDVSAVGNHEIDATLDGFYNASKDNNVTFVATNVKFEDEKMRDVIKKSFIKEKNGVKYGFVGAMPIDFKTCTKEDVQKGIEVMDFEDTVEELQKEIDYLKSKGIDRIIMLSHVGYDTDKELAQKLDGVDIIIGGHTHSVVDGAQENENIVKSKSNEPVVITQAGENGKYYGILNVEFDDNGVLSKVENKLTQATSRTKSPVLEYVKDQKLGQSPHVATIKEIEPMPQNRRIEPCAWTEVMADSMKNELHADIAIINSANIRKVPEKGNLTQRDITESAPMRNRLIKTKITQKQLVEAVRNSARSTMTSKDGYPGLLQGSGFSYKIDDAGELLEFNIIDKKGNIKPVDIDNPSEKITYTAIYDNFTSKADGEYPELAPKFSFKEYDYDKDTTMYNYLSKSKDKENLLIKCDNRIEIMQTSKEKQKDNNSRKI